MALSGPFRLRDLVRDKTGFTVRPEVPTGVLYPYAGSSAPSGYLLCDGSPLSTTTYAALHAIIGYTYGGSGGTFNLPDLRGRVPMGAGTGAQNGGSGSGAISGGTALTARSRGAFGGDERLQSHTHTGTTGNASANHSHVLRVNGNTTMYLANVAGGSGRFGLSSAPGSPIDVWDNGAAHTHGFTSDDHSRSGKGAQENMPPFVVTNYIIKT